LQTIIICKPFYYAKSFFYTNITNFLYISNAWQINLIVLKKKTRKRNNIPVSDIKRIILQRDRKVRPWNAEETRNLFSTFSNIYPPETLVLFKGQVLYICSCYFRPFERTIRLWTFSGSRGESMNLAIHPVMFFFYLLKYCDCPKTKLRSWYWICVCVCVWSRPHERVRVESLEILNLYRETGVICLRHIACH